MSKSERKRKLSSAIAALLSMWLDLPFVVGYLKGQTFSKPLSREEEQQAIELLLEGNEEARLTLIERNMRLVAHIVKKYSPPHEQIDDYISIGTIGLMKAVESFTPDKKTCLATYAARCIENEILMFLRAQKKVQKDISIHERVGTDKDGQSLEIGDLLQFQHPSPDEMLEQQESFQQLHRHLHVLEPRELEILTYRYGLFQHEPSTQKEIASKLGISRSYVSRIEKRALVKLYQQFKHQP